jgi:hypothetical protein
MRADTIGMKLVHAALAAGALTLSAAAPAHAFPAPYTVEPPTAELVSYTPAVLDEESQMVSRYTTPPRPATLFRGMYSKRTHAAPGVQPCPLTDVTQATMVMGGGLILKDNVEISQSKWKWTPKHAGPVTLCTTISESSYSVTTGPLPRDLVTVTYPPEEFLQHVVAYSAPTVIEVAPSPLGSTMEEVKERRREIKLEQQTGRKFCTIPAVRRLSAAAAMKRLRTAGCKVRPALRRYSPSVPRGRVITISPKTGQRTSIAPRLTISRGPRR